MLIGIQKTPKPGQPDEIQVFYAGHDATALHAKHAELVKANTEGKNKFILLRNPSYIPLASIPTPTEDAPEVLAARKRQAELAAKAAEAAKPEQAELINEETLGKKTKNQLLELAETKKVVVDEKASKAEIIAALLATA